MKPRRITKMRAARERLGITQLDLAIQIGVAQPAVSVWESRGAAIPKARAAQLSEILNVEPEQLALDFGEPIPKPKPKPKRQMS